MYTVFSGSPEYIRHDLNMDKGKLIREAAKKILNGQFFLHFFFFFVIYIFFYSRQLVDIWEYHVKVCR